MIRNPIEIVGVLNGVNTIHLFQEVSVAKYHALVTSAFPGYLTGQNWLNQVG